MQSTIMKSFQIEVLQPILTTVLKQLLIFCFFWQLPQLIFKNSIHKNCNSSKIFLWLIKLSRICILQSSDFIWKAQSLKIDIIGLTLLGWVLWHINYCGLFNAKSSLYIYILNIYDLVGSSFMAYQLLLVI